MASRRATGITSAISTDLNPRVLVSFLTVRQQRCQHRRTATAIPANVDRGLAIDRVVPTSTISSGPRRVSLSEDRVSKCQRRRTWHEPLTQVDPPIGDVVSGPGIHAGLEPSTTLWACDSVESVVVDRAALAAMSPKITNFCMGQV